MKLGWILSFVLILGGLLWSWNTSLSASSSRGEQESSSLNGAEGKLKELNKKLAQEKYLSSEVEKTTVLQLLGRTQKASGKLQVHKGKVRLELGAPEKSLLVVNEKEAWVVTYPPEDFPNAPIEAVVSELNGPSPNLGIAKVLSGQGILEVFKVNKVEKSGDTQKFSLEPLKTATEFQRGVLVTDVQVEKILELIYWDNLDNQVTYKFKKMKFSDKAPSAGIFSYKPAQGVNVTRL